MNKKSCFFTFASLVYLINALNSPAQTNSIQMQSRLPNISISKARQFETTAEEKLVRAIYEKLTKLNRAAQIAVAQTTERTNEDGVLRFELSDFRVSPIREIALTRADDLVSAPNGEIV